MATSGTSAPALDSQPSPHQQPPTSDFGQDIMASLDDIAAPVELRDLPDSGSPAVADPSISAGLTSNSRPATVEEQKRHDEGSEKHDASAAQGSRPGSKQQPKQEQGQPLADPAPVQEFSPDADGAALHISDTTDSAIGPATERPANQVDSEIGGAQQLIITLLMHATETRHPYIIDESYLRRRNVQVGEGDPTNMSVYTLKELILRDWRSEWDNKPTSPTSIRLIHYGRLLEDKAVLKDCRFVAGSAAHVVHMTVKPQELVDEEDARISKGGRSDRDGGERTPGCCCSVM